MSDAELNGLAEAAEANAADCTWRARPGKKEKRPMPPRR
jgi:hypothetical protein